MKMSGQYAKIEIDVDGTPVNVIELREWSVSASSEKIDSSVANEEWSDHEIGRKSWEGSATVLDVDTYWVDLMDSKVAIKFYDKESDTSPAYTGKASLDFERSTPYDDMIESSLTFTGAGKLTPKAAV